MRTEPINLPTKSWLILVSIFVAASFLIWLASQERTLGQGIKIVYLHAGLIWAGMVNFSFAGFLGLAVTFSAEKKIQARTQTIGWVALLLFATGIGRSIVAAKINWEAFFWSEPRMIASLQFHFRKHNKGQQ